MNLQRCLLNSGLVKPDRDEILAAAAMYEQRGKSVKDAALQAIQDKIDILKKDEAAILKQVSDAFLAKNPDFKPKAEEPAPQVEPDRPADSNPDQAPLFSREGWTPDQKLTDEAKQFFGVTLDSREAGYILPDGSMLDFSGRHYSDNHPSLRGQRSVDHRELAGQNSKGMEWDSLGSGSGSDLMQRFMAATGAMRVDQNSGIASIMRPPSQAQITALANMRRGDYLAVSYIDPENGRLVDEKEIESASPMNVRRFFDAAVEKGPGTGAQFARLTNPADLPPRKRMTAAEFGDIVAREFSDAVAKRLPAILEPLETQAEIARRFPNVHAAMREGDTIFGFYDPRTGKTYVVLENLAPDMVKGLVLHEVGTHYGFEAMLGDKYPGVLTQLEAMRRAGNKNVIAAHETAQREASSPRQVPEEALAYLVQNHPEMTFVQRIIAQIKAFLFRKLGMPASMLTTNDLVMLARAAVKHATNNVVINSEAAQPQVEFARAPQTDSPAFKAWFGDSKVVDAEGKPLVVYHGTAGNFSEFSPDFAGSTTYSASGLDGFFFTKDADTASKYAKVAQKTQHEMYGRFYSNANVMPVYLALSNPLVYRKQRGDASTLMDTLKRRVISDAKAMGHDGVVFQGFKDTPNGRGDSADVYVAFRPEQIKSAIGNVGTFDPANPDIRFARSGGKSQQPAPYQPGLYTWNSPVASRMSNIIYKLQDKQVDLRDVTREINKSIGPIADDLDAYLQEELYHGRVAKQTQDFITKELKPLMGEMSIRGVTMDELQEYLHNRHAEERNIQIAKVNPAMKDGGSGIDTADARAYLAGLAADKRTQLDAIAKKVDAILAETRQTLINYGLESPDTIRAWESAYQNYVPLMREDMEGTPGTGQGFSVKGSSAKRATGSNRAVVDVLANVVMQRERAIVRGEKNRVATALIGLAATNPNVDFWQVDNPPKINTVINGLAVQMVDPNYKNRPNVLTARIPDVTGRIVEHAVVFNEQNERALRAAESLKNLDMDTLSGALAMVGKATRYLASINTQYNPIFGVVNLIRDVQGAAFNLSSTPLAGKQLEVGKHLASALRGIYIDMRDIRDGKQPNSTWANLYEEMAREGGKTGFRDLFASSAERTEKLEAMIRDHGKSNWAKWRPSNIEDNPIFGWLSDYNEAMESATRLAAYKTAIDMGMSKQRAASVAKNITVNFNRKGQVGQQMGALYAFFNASVQGTARLAETLKGPAGKKIILGGLILGSMQALILAAAGFDEDDPPDFVKERNLIFPIGNKKYISLPMPLGLHVIPNISRIATEHVLSGFKNTGKRLENLVGMLAEAFNPVGNAGLSMQTVAPTVLDPVAALVENRDWTGKPIAKKDRSSLEPTPGHTRAKDTASTVGMMTSKALNWLSGGTQYTPGILSPTPDQIDYLIGQATGGVGRELLKVNQVASSAITGEDLPPHKIPLLGRFYGDASHPSSQSGIYYKNLTDLNVHQAEIKGRKKAGEDVVGYIQSNPEAVLAQAADASYRRVQDLRSKKRDLMQRNAPKEQTRLIQDRINAEMARFNEMVRARKEGKKAQEAPSR